MYWRAKLNGKLLWLVYKQAAAELAACSRRCGRPAFWERGHSALSGLRGSPELSDPPASFLSLLFTR